MKARSVKDLMHQRSKVRKAIRRQETLQHREQKAQIKSARVLARAMAEVERTLLGITPDDSVMVDE